MPKAAIVTSLDTDERQKLRAQWDDIVCEWCHAAHKGQCTRIREIVREYHPNGQLAKERIKLWRKWKPAADAIGVDELPEPKGKKK